MIEKSNNPKLVYIKSFFNLENEKKNRKDSMHAQCTGEEVSILYYIIWYDMY